jgi:hypothetical protein
MPRPLSHNGLIVLKVAHSNPKEVYEGLVWEAKNRGYKDGWIAHKFKEIFGKWPKPTSAITPRPPCSELREWFCITRTRYRAKKGREKTREQTKAKACQGIDVDDTQDVGEGRTCTARSTIQAGGN